MKSFTTYPFSALFFLAAAVSALSAGASPQGPYLGETPPGMTPQIFAPGIVSTSAHEFSCSFSPDGKEFYFSRRDAQGGRTLIMVTRCVDGAWTEPETVSFNLGGMSFEPRVTPDGGRLYFTSDQPVPGQETAPMNVWYVEREGDRWGDPRAAGYPFSPGKVMCVSVTLGGTIYATDISAGPGSEGISVARSRDGSHSSLERLGAPINIGAQDMYPYVAPDEMYLVFNSRRPSGKAVSGLFVSFRNADGSWMDPRAIDLGMPAGIPMVSPDGRYLFFTAGERGKSDIYWVEARIIWNLRAGE